MKHIQHIDELFGISKNKQGNIIAQKVIDIIKAENIEILWESEHDNMSFDEILDRNGYYYVQIDDKKYHFADNRIIINNNSESAYFYSKKYYKEIEKLFYSQRKKEKSTVKNKFAKDLEELDDTHRAAKKYNL